jgi:cytochrome c biogenesis protein CcmG, thiol:disulfide interchange protein DsbE
MRSDRIRRRCAALAGAALALAIGSAQPARIGEPAPALRVPQFDGKTFDLAAQRGKVVIVNFWASWCAPCRSEMALLDSFYQRYRARGLVVLGLSVDEAQDRAEVLRIMQQRGYPGALAASASVNGFGPPVAVPTTWIIDTQGRLRARLLAGNSLTEQSLTQTVVPLLPPPAAPGRR